MLRPLESDTFADSCDKFITLTVKKIGSQECVANLSSLSDNENLESLCECKVYIPFINRATPANHVARQNATLKIPISQSNLYFYSAQYSQKTIQRR